MVHVIRWLPMEAKTLEDGTKRDKGLQLHSSQELMPIHSDEFTILFPSEKISLGMLLQ
ncbi:uncharacterized protein DS421_12g384030 [Arachis hypogaea]|nr:uncharacterized protein DS421_12g384030 [Arachis hypogaea]